MIELLWPWLLLLAPLPLAVMYWWPPAGSAEPALHAPFFVRWQQLSGGSEGLRRARSALTQILLWLIWLTLLLAAARPQWIGDPVALPSEGRDLLVAVDISGSMRQEDMRLGRTEVQRITVVKQVVGEFIEQRRGDRLGLILFGENAYVQSPLTFDTQTVGRFLHEAEIGFAGEQATAIGDAIGLAVKRLRDRPAASRVVVLLTDGASNAGVDPKMAAAMAAGLGIRIYTVGVGADEMIVRGLLGSRRVNPSRDLDESTLLDIADVTGGQYFRARDPAELAEIYRVIHAMEPVEQEEATYRPTRSLFYWPLGVALGLSLLGACSRAIGALPFQRSLARVLSRV